MVDWSDLPYELVLLISNYLIELDDFVSFSSVCRSWRLIYLNKDWAQNRRTPWLFINEFTENDISRKRFLGVSKLKKYTISLQDALGCQCWGTPLGYVVTLDRNFAIRLMNPVTRLCIDLPSLYVLWSGSSLRIDWFDLIQKAIVLKVGDSLVTFVTYRTKGLHFCKIGDTKWNFFPLPNPVSVIDVVSFQDQIFAITLDGKMMVLEINKGERGRALFVASPPEYETKWSNMYLVESSGSLLLVFGYELGLWRQNMVRFKVYKFDVSRRKWSLVDDLGDTFLLVDEWSCIAGSSYCCFKPNCVYYTNDTLESFAGVEARRVGQQQVTVYNVKDESREFYWVTDNHPYCYTFPMWMMPSLCLGKLDTEKMFEQMRKFGYAPWVTIQTPLPLYTRIATLSSGYLFTVQR